MILSDKIKSLRDTVGIGYTKPDPAKMAEFVSGMNDRARKYLLEERGLSDETIKHFNLGYDATRDAIAIPIYKNGELINIKYRILEPKENKYTSERNAEPYFYNEDGINKALNKGGILIVEGEFDLMSAYQAGVTNVVSPVAGKDSFGVFLELLDNVPRIYIAYDNDVPGKESSKKLAERLGIEKCLEVKYPDGIKDANEYFKKYTRDDFISLIKSSTPFYKYQFKGVGDIIESLRFKKPDIIKLDHLPGVELQKDWLVVISGATNVGKTSYALNLAVDLTKQKIPTLIFPFERGVDTVGKRFLQIKFDKTIQDFEYMNEQEWTDVTSECIETPAYFAMPKKNEIVETIVKAKRLFDTRVVIIDHLDYIIRHVQGNKEAEISNTLQDLKRVAEEHGIIMLIITHIRKIESAGSTVKKKPNIEDLKGAASLYQDPECVVMLTPDSERVMAVSVLKNKGEMKEKKYTFSPASGKLYNETKTNVNSTIKHKEESFPGEKDWND